MYAVPLVPFPIATLILAEPTNILPTGTKHVPVTLILSVGRRSSVLAEKVQKQLLEQGSTRVLNLENGIFGWHNETRKLTRGTDETEFVHPYSWRWGRLIEREDLIRYDLD